MFDCNQWMDLLIEKLKEKFAARLLFVGLQGSYGRGEANEESDIDPVIILDRLDDKDLAEYRALLSEMPNRDKGCGFISGLEEIQRWDAADVFQLYHDVTPRFGNLESLQIAIPQDAARRSILLGACNIYHIVAHNYLHGQHAQTLCGQLKSAAFILQARYFEKTGHYVRKHKELLQLLTGEDQQIMQFSLMAKAGDPAIAQHWEMYSMRLWKWASALIKEYGQ